MFRRLTSLIAACALALGLSACGQNKIAFEPGSSSGGGNGGLGNPGDPGNSADPSPPPPACAGCPAPQKASEGFLQTPPDNSVDILMVIDNSPSMEYAQSHISVGFNSLISSLGTIDWQIGFTTTDVALNNGKLAGLTGMPGQVLSRGTAGADKIFHDTVMSFGTKGSGDERGIYAANDIVLQGNGANAALFRQGAALAIVVLSDEDERSTGGRNETHNGNATTGAIETNDLPQTLINSTRTVFGPDKKLSGYGIVLKSWDVSCYNFEQQGFYGTFYENFAAMTGGAVGSLCDSDYSKTLSGIGQNIATLLNSVSLSHIPVGNKVGVHLDPQQDDVEWSVSGNKVVFNKPPGRGTKITVNYYWQP